MVREKLSSNFGDGLSAVSIFYHVLCDIWVILCDVWVSVLVKFVSFYKEHKFATNNFAFEPRDGGMAMPYSQTL